MERENFYILLDLSVDPPETNPKTIEAAIAEKQADWSRLRNHPSKGLQAQKYITLIPEIRQVMSDVRLREKEAQSARDHFLKDKESKYPAIDSNIDILMGKGFVAKEEIIRLASVHGLSESEIQSRITAKKEEKFGKIDQQIRLRMAKGYLTEAEIERLAKRHNLKTDEIKLRIHCPVRKNGNAKNEPPPRQLDRSIEKALRDNLKIIGKTSLYDFLELPESADLEQLQEAAVTKKKTLAAIGKKSADLTAGNTLAGHCFTVFKTEESRTAYDVGLAKSKLAELDSDIDISGINGRIRPEYYEILVQKAMDFGMEKEEAKRYIKEYCKRKKWSVEVPHHKKRRQLIAGVVALTLIAVVIAAGWMTLNSQRAEARKTAFADLIRKVEQEQSPDSRVLMLQHYIRNHQGQNEFSEFVEDARRRIDQYYARLAETAFKDKMASVDVLAQKDEYEAAKAVIADYLKSNPPPSFAQKAAAEISNIDRQIENRDFNAVSRVMLEGRADEKIEAIRVYLETHPKGAHAAQAKQMRNDISTEYYIFVKNALYTREADMDWSGCAELAKNYIDLYDNSYSDQLQQQLALYKEKIRQDRIFSALKQKAEDFGQDYRAAIKMYRDYLAAYPDVTFSDRIAEEINSLEYRLQEKKTAEAEEEIEKLLYQSGDRFTRKSEGVILDKRTGLMWALHDSSISLPDTCLSHKEAEAYVDGLTTGGYSDWRLPTADELVAIYKQVPYFPTLGEKWYWTSNSYSSYSDGWRKVIDTITSSPDNKGMERRDSFECGTVRAVRGK